MTTSQPVFLTAEWRDLIMVNYAVDPEILKPHIPPGVELDFYQGRTFISIVGFQFLDVRVKGWAIPWHRNFDEINLRFYVRREDDGEMKRGVCFIKEFAPRFAVCTIANVVFKENYQRAPVRHQLRIDEQSAEAKYEWRVAGVWNHIAARAETAWQPMPENSEAEFIAEHYWGYAGNDVTREYAVEHPRWRYRPASEFEVECDVDRVYGARFAKHLKQTPSSVFLADGSPITVRSATTLHSKVANA